MRSLPIDPFLPLIAESVRTRPVVIVNSPAGSGKSLRILPAILKALPREWQVYQTEPRSTLVQANALRMLEEQAGEGWRSGVPVGYIAGADRSVAPGTRAVLLSEQTLINRLASESIETPTVVIVDEAHLRSCQTDILLGLLKVLLRINGDTLRIVIASATAHVAKLELFFPGACVINVVGRPFPTTYELHSAEHPLRTLVARVKKDLELFLNGSYVVGGSEFEEFCVRAGTVALQFSGEEELEAVSAEIIRHALKLVPDATWANIPGGYFLCAGPQTFELLKIYRAFDERSQAERRLREAVPEGCLRIVLGTEIIRTGLTMKGLIEVHDSGFVKRLVDDNGIGKLETQYITQAEAYQTEGRLGRLSPGRYNLYLKPGLTREQLDLYPEPELLKQPLTRTVLAIRSAGFSPTDFPFIDAPGAGRLAEAERRLRSLRALTKEGIVTALGQELRRLLSRPEEVVAILHGEKKNVAGETLIAAVASRSGCSPFHHAKRDQWRTPHVTSAEVVRLILSHCDLREEADGWYARYDRYEQYRQPEEVDLGCLPRWITPRPDGNFCINFVDDGLDTLSDKGRFELALLIRQFYARGTGSDFVALVNVYRAFAAQKKNYGRISGALSPDEGVGSEKNVQERLVQLKEWCEHRLLNFNNLRVIWHSVGELITDLKRADIVLRNDITVDRSFSAAALSTSLLPLFEDEIAAVSGNHDLYRTVRGQPPLVEPAWQSATRGQLPLPRLLFAVNIREYDRAGERGYFAEFCAPIEPEWLVAYNPERWRIVHHEGVRERRTLAEEYGLYEASWGQQEILRFRRRTGQAGFPLSR